MGVGRDRVRERERDRETETERTSERESETGRGRKEIRQLFSLGLLFSAGRISVKSLRRFFSSF